MNATVEPTLPAAPTAADAGSAADGRRIHRLGAPVDGVWMLVLSKRERTDDAYVNGKRWCCPHRCPGPWFPCSRRHAARPRRGSVVKLDPTDAEIDLARAESALRRQSARSGSNVRPHVNTMH